jgi:hypothetical protein
MKKQQKRIFLSLLSTLPIAGILAGCSTGNTFAKVNGQSVTHDEYVKALERQMVSPGQGQQPIPAERYVIDYLVGNKVILAAAGKLNAVPTEQDINSYYTTQKRLFEESNIGKNYEEEVKRTGSTVDEVKNEIKMQLAEANIYTRKTNLGDKDINEAYDKLKAAKRAGLPKRVQLRLVTVVDKSADYAAVEKALKENKSLEEIARQYNPAQLKAVAGLFPVAQPIENFPPDIRAKIEATKDGGTFGPVVFPQMPPGQKVWVGVVEKRAELNLSLEDMRSILRRQIVQEHIIQEQQQQEAGGPEGDFLKVRREIIKEIVKKAKEGGLGEAPKAPAKPAGIPAMGAPAAGAPVKPMAPAPKPAAPK